MTVISKRKSGALYVGVDGYWYRRAASGWQMQGHDGEWFDCPLHRYDIKNMVADFENCLRSYAADEGPEYPRNNKKGKVAAFFRALQTKELYACTKGIFAPVRIKYDAHKENLARFNREAAAAMRSIPGPDRRLDAEKYAEAMARKRKPNHNAGSYKQWRFEAVRLARTNRVLMQALA